MDGRERWMAHVFIERLWRSLKYKDVYLKGYSEGREAKAGIAALKLAAAVSMDTAGCRKSSLV
jgi:hypothetical protein